MPVPTGVSPPRPTTLDLSRVDWAEIGDLVCQAMTQATRSSLRLKLLFPDATPEQAAAMAVTQLVRERLEELAAENERW